MQQQSSMDAVGRRRPTLFKVLHPEFLKKLRLPFAFVLKSGLKPGMATIRTQLGVWHVNLEGEGDGRSSILFGAGWPEFSKDHNLCMGYFMVFRYQGNMVFDAEIFDKTCCGVDYTSEQQNNVDEQETEDQGARTASKSSNRRTARRKPVPPVPETAPDQEPKNASSDDSPERPAVVAACAPIIPQFEKIITMDRRMVVPYGFCSSTGLLSATEITINDEENRGWKVDFWSKPLKCRLGKGFRKFIEANGVKVGDKCIFRLVSPRTLQVRVIRNQPPLPQARRRKLISHGSA